MTPALVCDRAGKKGTLVQKLEARTNKSGGPDACWPWTGSVGQWEQPFVCHLNKTYSCRRLVWELKTRSAPAANRWVRTTCENPRCLNPKHLALRSVHDVVSKFWEKVDKRGPDDCWPWQGGMQKGYGRFHSYDDQHVFAHRFSYELHHGKIQGHVAGDPELEKCVCHRCDNPRCVNPAHLFLGTDQDNHDDMVAKGRHARGEKLSKAMKASAERRKQRIAACEVLSNGGEKVSKT